MIAMLFLESVVYSWQDFSASPSENSIVLKNQPKAACKLKIFSSNNQSREFASFSLNQ
jgi:hypothetical protein